MNHLGYTVTGSLDSCDACRMAKARAKGVKKLTATRSVILGEQMYIAYQDHSVHSLEDPSTGYKL